MSSIQGAPRILDASIDPTRLYEEHIVYPRQVPCRGCVDYIVLHISNAEYGPGDEGGLLIQCDCVHPAVESCSCDRCDVAGQRCYFIDHPELIDCVKLLMQRYKTWYSIASRISRRTGLSRARQELETSLETYTTLRESLSTSRPAMWRAAQYNEPNNYGGLVMINLESLFN